MIRTRYLFPAMLLAVLHWGCEKDDLCPGDSTNTPLLQLGFYDVNDPETPKAVPRLRVVGQGANATVNTFTDRTSRESVFLPLKNLENSTTFYFVFDSADNTEGTETGNPDLVQFNYQVKERFESRACGVVVSYENLQTVYNPDSAPWITSVVVEQSTIDNQDVIHVKILH